MAGRQQRDPAIPRYSADPSPPVKLPPGRSIGPAISVQVSPDGHIWIMHMASHPQFAPLAPGEDPGSRMPPVCEFDADGNFLQGWGGPDWLPREDGLQQWPRQEETIYFDGEERIWVFGADKSHDHAVQRFSRDGKLLLRIGCFAETRGDDSPDRMGCPTDAWLDTDRREVYITDGYVNHRVAVFNSETGAFIRSFGAYGKAPVAGDNASESFNNPVHAISLGPDGFLYVCDRKNDRVQVFDAIGRTQPRFIREIAVDHESPFGTTFNLAFTPDGEFMLVNDGSYCRLWIVDLARWEFVGSFLTPDARTIDQGGTVHKISCDAAGNLLLASTSKGMERMRYDGLG